MARILLAAAVPLVLSHAAPAQYMGNPQQTQISIQYHEVVPAGGDELQARAKIYAEVHKDCDTAAKAFDRKCVINQINFNDNTNNNYFAGVTGVTVVTANAMLSLVEEPAAAPPK